MEFNLIKIGNDINIKRGELEYLKEELSNNPLYQRIKLLEKEIAEQEKNMELEESAIINYMLDNNLEQVEHMGMIYKVKDTSRPSVEVEDINLVPFEFRRIKEEVDKNSIIKIYKETGILIPGTNVVKNPKYKLEIKTKKTMGSKY